MAVAKKHWVQVLAPTMFHHELLGESYVLETDSLTGRGISVNLMNLTGDMKKQSLLASFRITSVKDGKAHTRVTGIQMQPSSVKRLVRRGRSKIDSSFLVPLAHDQVARIKPLVITKSLTNNTVATALRHKVRETLTDLCKGHSFETLVQDIVHMKVQRHVRTQLNTVFPIRSVDIRSFALEPKHALEEEHAAQETNYGSEQPDEDADRS
jgi:ribosomal protein S3AE